MRMKKLMALVLTLSMLVGMLSVLPMSASAAEITLTDSYEQSVNGQWVFGIDNWDAARGVADIICYRSGYNSGYTGTNEWGTEIVVNRYGYVTEIRENIGNAAIPDGGYVLSAHTDAAGLENKVGFFNAIENGTIKVGDLLLPTETGGSQYCVYRVTDDDKLCAMAQADNITFAIPYTALLENTNRASAVTMGDDGVTTGSTVWQTDILCKIIGYSNDGYAKGYVVKVGGNNTEVPEGYFAVTAPGQTYNDNGTYPYNAAQLFREYASVGTTFNLGSNEVYFVHDAAAAIRAAHLLTGVVNEAIGVDKVYDFSANTIYTEAMTNYELVDTATMKTLYDNMQAITSTLSDTMALADFDSHMATLYQNFDELQMLEFEKRPVEMRAIWIRPFNSSKAMTEAYADYTAEQFDEMIEKAITDNIALGYNMMFIEAFYNSTTVMPIPDGVGYNGLALKQKPYLIPVSEGGTNTKLTENYDALQRFIDLCNKHDVEAHVWWQVFYVGYERPVESGLTDALFEYSVAYTIKNDTTGKYEGYLNESNTGSLYFGATGDSAYQYFLNPASDGARTLLMNTFEHLWKTYDIVSFQLDYIRYPHTNDNGSFGYDDATVNGFLAAYPQYTEADLQDTHFYYYNEDWINYRAAFVTSFVKGIHETMSEIRPDMYLTASPAADPAGALREIMQDVGTWIENGYVDVLFPMAYGENIPGDTTAGLVEANPDRFVCTTVSNSYLTDELEERWAREIREAGADGFSSFGKIPEYVEYVWSDKAISPLKNATRAARVYLNEVVAARVERMLSYGDITADDKEELLSAIEAADRACELYGVESTQAALALSELQLLGEWLAANPAAALTKDVNYIFKIAKNSRDAAKQEKSTSDADLTINGDTVQGGGDGFVYTAATETLYITENEVTLSGNLPENVTLVLGDGVDTLTLENMTLPVTALETDSETMTVTLFGDNTVAANVFGDNVTYLGTGTLYSGDELVMCKGDVDDSDDLDSSDLRKMLRYCVNAVSFTEEQIAFGDADGAYGVNTTDVRMFMEEILYR